MTDVINQTQETFVGMSIHWEESWKFKVQWSIFDEVGDVWKAEETLSQVFDIPSQLKNEKKWTKWRSKIVQIYANWDQVSKRPFFVWTWWINGLRSSQTLWRHAVYEPTSNILWHENSVINFHIVRFETFCYYSRVFYLSLWIWHNASNIWIFQILLSQLFYEWIKEVAFPKLLG